MKRKQNYNNIVILNVIFLVFALFFVFYVSNLGNFSLKEITTAGVADYHTIILIALVTLVVISNLILIKRHISDEVQHGKL